MAVVTAEIRFAPKNAAWFTTNASLVLADGEIVYRNTDGKYIIGDGTTPVSGLTFYGGVSTTPAWGSITGTLSNQTDLQNALNAKLDSATAALTYQPIGSYLTSSAIGVTVQGYSANTTLLGNSTTGSGSIVLATSPTFGTDITTPKINGVSGTLSFANANQSSGAVTSFSFTAPNNTGQTASTNIPNFRVNGSTKTWAAGAITNQYWNYFTANTAAFASASTITNSYGLFVEAATAGTNATITNNYALGTNGNVIFDDGTSKMIWRAIPTVPTYSAIFLNQTPSSTNAALYGDGSLNTFLNGGNSAYIAVGTSNVARFGLNFALFTAQNKGVGSSIPFDIAPVSATNTTASTEVNTLRVGNSFTRTWATGAITTQRFIYFPTQTIAFGSASTVTTAYGMYVEDPTAGTNATITNNYAAGFGGNVNIVTGELRQGGVKVVGARDTGWTAFTNTTNKATSYDTSTVTLQQLAERVAAIQAALTTHGLIGA